jgi:hypothetical protein
MAVLTTVDTGRNGLLSFSELNHIGGKHDGLKKKREKKKKNTVKSPVVEVPFANSI